MVIYFDGGMIGASLRIQDQEGAEHDDVTEASEYGYDTEPPRFRENSPRGDRMDARGGGAANDDGNVELHVVLSCGERDRTLYGCGPDDCLLRSFARETRAHSACCEAPDPAAAPTPVSGNGGRTRLNPFGRADGLEQSLLHSDPLFFQQNVANV